MWAPTKWQRMVLLAAATTCFANAWRLYSNDDPAGSSFIAGILFLVVALIRPLRDEDWLPAVPPLMVRNWKAIVAAILVLAIAGAALTFWSEQARLADETRRQRAAEVAERERIRMLTPAERKIESAYALCLRKAVTDDYSKIYAEYNCRFIRDRSLTKVRERPDPIAATLEAMAREDSAPTQQ